MRIREYDQLRHACIRDEFVEKVIDNLAWVILRHACIRDEFVEKVIDSLAWVILKE